MNATLYHKLAYERWPADPAMSSSGVQTLGCVLSSQSSVEFSVGDGFSDVFRPDGLRVFEVGDCPSDLADFVMGAGGKAELGHRLLQYHLAVGVEGAELFDLLVGHCRVGRWFAVAEAVCLDVAGFDDVGFHCLGAELGGSGAELGEGDWGDVDVDVDAVNERAGDFREVSFNLAGGAFAASPVGAEVAAGAGVHSGNEHKAGGESDGFLGA